MLTGAKSGAQGQKMGFIKFYVQGRIIMLFLCLGVVDEENFHNIYTHLFPWGEEALYQYKNIIHPLFL